jgi:DNA-binding transcriptional ArsR family regulator
MSTRGMTLTTSECAGIMRAMGDATRLRILESLLAREKCVNDLVTEIRHTQPHISHHLRILREAGLIEGMREGKRICYRISPKIRMLLEERRGKALDFGCCRISFPEAVLAAHSR